MSGPQVLEKFYIEFDRIASAGAPGYEPNEVEILINIAMEQCIVNYYNFKSNPQQYGFEETEKRIEDLGDLVRYKTHTTFSPGFLPNSVTITLPNTLVDGQGNPQTSNPPGPTNFDDVAWFIIYDAVITDKLECNSTTNYKKPLVKEITHQELANMLQDPFNSPNVDRQVFKNRYEGRKIALITDGNFSITSYTLGYIRKPQPVSLSNSVAFLDIPDHLQREIIEKAVTLSLEKLGDSRYPISKQALITVE